tara:strand:+ start:342 stop:572 length:231 start_codon:yes stop_codon:yes gene_type:complete
VTAATERIKADFLEKKRLVDNGLATLREVSEDLGWLAVIFRHYIKRDMTIEECMEVVDNIEEVMEETNRRILSMSD